jgi:hypothetical protein
MRRPVGEADDLVPASQLRIQLGKRDRRVGCRFELLYNVDRTLEIPMFLLELGKRQADRVAGDRELGGHALRYRELETGLQILRDELVGRRVFPVRERIVEEPLGIAGVASEHH